MQVEFIKSAYKSDQYPPPHYPEIAFAGRSNVGKSSLINVLTNRRKLARTSSRPGRTQAINFFLVNKAIYLVDLPGYGYAKVPVHIKRTWGSMVESYLRTRHNLRGVVLILDVRREMKKEEWDLVEWLKYYGIPIILVITKVDKVARHKAIKKAKEVEKSFTGELAFRPFLFSAKTREGRDEIWEAVNTLSGLSQ